MPVEILEVGQPIAPGKWFHHDQIQYTYNSAGHRLLLILGNLKKKDIEAIAKGPAWFAFSWIPPVIFFHFRFEGVLDWSESPYTWHMVKSKARQLPPLDFDPEQGAALSIVLAEAPRGIVRALRLIAMPHGFTLKLHQIIREQAENKFDQAAYNIALDQLYKVYTSEQLIARPNLPRFKAGDREEYQEG